jgi:cytoskeletal protein RodZ
MTDEKLRLNIFWRIVMKRQIQSLWLLSALVVFLSVGISLNAQDSTSQTKTPEAQSQPAQAPAQTQEGQPSQTPESQSSQAPDQSQQQAPPSQAPDAGKSAPPDSQAPAASSTDAQSFTGTIVKSGDKYKFQDADTGNIYDIDHQDQVQKFEGKKVKVHGTLDPSTKTIHVQ